MDANLLMLVQDAMGRDFSNLAGHFLGESPESTQQAVTSLVPTVLGSVAQKGATPAGALRLLNLVNGTNLDASVLGNFGRVFAGGGGATNDLMKAGTSSLVPALFGDKSGALVNALSSSSGLKTSSATSLIAIVVPIVLTFLKKFVGDRGLDASSLSSLLARQGPNLQNMLDPRITGALGFASPTEFLGGMGALGGQAADTAKRAGATLIGGAGATAAAATTAGRSPLSHWLTWVIGAVVLFFLWNVFTGKPASTSTSPAPVVSAPAPTVVALPSKVYFETGSAVVGAEGGKTLVAIADLVKRDNVTVTITGYTDKSGDATANEALAKSRADAVRDALKAAGVAETSVEMRPPMLVEIGAPGTDAEARRVEIARR